MQVHIQNDGPVTIEIDSPKQASVNAAQNGQTVEADSLL